MTRFKKLMCECLSGMVLTIRFQWSARNEGTDMGLKVLKGAYLWSTHAQERSRLTVECGEDHRKHSTYRPGRLVTNVHSH